MVEFNTRLSNGAQHRERKSIRLIEVFRNRRMMGMRGC